MRNFIQLFLILLSIVFIFPTYSAVLPTRNPFIPTPISMNAKPVIPVTNPPALHACWIPLYFAKAHQVADFLSHPSSDILSSTGKINFDKRSNQIWVKDDAKHLMIIRKIIHHLDQPGPQFLIKAKIINIDRQYQKNLGVLFQTQPKNMRDTASMTMNEPNVDNNAGEFTFTIAKLNAGNLLNLQLSALEQEGHASLISSPSLTTLNNQPAVIESGAEVPYEHATASGATSVSFKKAVLRLQVTPERMPHQHILLHIALNQDKVSALTVKGVPAIETQRITTQVVVKDRQTIVLGGILETTQTRQKQGIPGLNHLPMVGGLFEEHKNLMVQQELLIFITPSMMKV